jgi:hypothetical protein
MRALFCRSFWDEIDSRADEIPIQSTGGRSA